MTQSIYKSYQSKMKEAWYQLSSQEQEAVWKNIGEVMVEFGVKLIMHFDAISEGQWFGLLEYPDLETYQKAEKRLWEIGYYRYFDITFAVGTRRE